MDFATSDSCSQALRIDPSPLGPRVEVKFAIQRGAKAASNSGEREPKLPPPVNEEEARSIVVTGTHPEIFTEALFENFFAQFGKVESVKLSQKRVDTRA